MGAIINKNFNSMKKILFLAAFCLTVGLAMAQKPVKSNTQQPAQTATTQQQCSGNHSACPHQQQAQAQPKCQGNHSACPHQQQAQAQPKCQGNHSACPHQQAQAQPKGDKTANQQAPKK